MSISYHIGIVQRAALAHQHCAKLDDLVSGDVLHGDDLREHHCDLYGGLVICSGAHGSFHPDTCSVTPTEP